MTQPVRCWLCKHEDQSSKPSTLGKLNRRHGSVSLCIVDVRGRDRQIHGCCWSSSPGLHTLDKFSEKTCLRY